MKAFVPICLSGFANVQLQSYLENSRLKKKNNCIAEHFHRVLQTTNFHLPSKQDFINAVLLYKRKYKLTKKSFKISNLVEEAF